MRKYVQPIPFVSRIKIAKDDALKELTEGIEYMIYRKPDPAEYYQALWNKIIKLADQIRFHVYISEIEKIQQALKEFENGK